MKVTVIKSNNSTKRINRKKRVAAYARVSTLSEEQEESFESQVSYYKALITANPNYEFVGIYADQGISGLSASKRPEFLKMIKQAKAGKIDLILCKSISRFGRNAAEVQVYLRDLKDRKVEVIFEKEGISTFNPMMEMVLNIMSIIAQEESRSISENVVWGLDRQAERGIRHLGNNRMFGYDEINGVLTPNYYAPAVKMIYEEYAKGTRITTIKKYLDQMGCVGMISKKPLSSQSILHILENVIYKGDRLLQKKPHPNYLTKKPDYTKEFNQYYITDAHEAIVSKELWDAVQVERNRRIKEHTYGNPEKVLPVRFRNSSHPLFGKVICAECGSPFERKTSISGGKHIKIWRCKKRNGECHSRSIHEKDLLAKVEGINLSDIEKVLINHDKTIVVEMKKKYERLVPPLKAPVTIKEQFENSVNV